jgi:hypothetical protein
MIVKIMLSALVVSVMNLYGIEDLICAVNFAVSAKTASNQPARTQQDYPVRGEIRQSYKLAPGANVEVSGIEGSVIVETTGGDKAELHWVRQARTQNDYDCETIVVENSSKSLVVQHQTKKSAQCRTIQASEQMKLLVPRSANLKFSNIEGNFTAGATDGFLQLRNIEGAVRIEQAQSAEISSIESDLFLNVAQVNPRGINIHNIEGAVDLGISKNLNADLIGSDNLENVQINIPNIQSTAFDRKNYRLRIGAGGAGISISNIEGGVKLRGI